MMETKNGSSEVIAATLHESISGLERIRKTIEANDIVLGQDITRQLKEVENNIRGLRKKIQERRFSL